MEISLRSVIGAQAMGPVVPVKRPGKQVHWRVDQATVEDLERISARTNRPINEVVDLLLKWAILRENSEVEAVEDETTSKRKKRES
jgi:hypothetical protein